MPVLTTRDCWIKSHRSSFLLLAWENFEAINSNVANFVYYRKPPFVGMYDQDTHNILHKIARFYFCHLELFMTSNLWGFSLNWRLRMMSLNEGYRERTSDDNVIF